MSKSTFSIISQSYGDVFTGSAYLAPNIPEKKINGAIEGIARKQVAPNQVLLVFDTTLWGGAGDGILLTRDTLFYKELLQDPHQVDFAAIQAAEYKCDVSVNKKGKEVTYLRSSAELTTGEMTLSIDRFRNWSASVAGIYLPSANEQQMLIFAQQEIERNKEFI